MSTHARRPPGTNALRLRERDEPPAERKPREWPALPRPSRPQSIAMLATAGTLLTVGTAGYLYDRSRDDLIAPGVKVAGVNVGGLRIGAARARLRDSLVTGLRDEPIVISAANKRFSLTRGEAHVRVDVDGLAAAALARSRRGSIFSRVIDGLDGRRDNIDLPIMVTYSHDVVHRVIADVEARANTKPRDASVVPSATGLEMVASSPGHVVDGRKLGARIDEALVSATALPRVHAPMHRIAPSVTTAQLASKFPAYIVIDRAAFRLRFYRHLKLARTYRIAVGRQGLETPAGLYDIQWKEVNPPWHVPNSSWAGKLAGKTIPPGPQDPIKARWMAFNGGAGIHGTSETSSLGSAASHGCIRMAIPDVIALYPMVPVGTPVFVA